MTDLLPVFRDDHPVIKNAIFRAHECGFFRAGPAALNHLRSMRLQASAVRWLFLIHEKTEATESLQLTSPLELVCGGIPTLDVENIRSYADILNRRRYAAQRCRFRREGGIGVRCWKNTGIAVKDEHLRPLNWTLMLASTCDCSCIFRWIDSNPPVPKNRYKSPALLCPLHPAARTERFERPKGNGDGAEVLESKSAYVGGARKNAAKADQPTGWVERPGYLSTHGK